MTAVLLAVVAAGCFGAMPVAVRHALGAAVPPSLGTLAMQATAFAVIALASVAEGPSVDGVLPFLLAGVIAPGASQIFITLGIRDAGSSRASVAFGTAPVFAVVIALVALHERPGPATLVGASLVVAGGIALAVERDRPPHVRRLGIVYALIGALLFAIRDNIVRHLSLDTGLPPLSAGAATLAAALVVTACVATVRRERLVAPRRALGRWAAPGVLVGLAYIALFEAFYRGTVTVVAPVVGTESLWGVVLSALLLGRSERVTRRLAAGAVLVVAGGVLIGIFR